MVWKIHILIFIFISHFSQQASCCDVYAFMVVTMKKSGKIQLEPCFAFFCDCATLPQLSFLSHPSRRLEWAIVIAHRPSSVRPSSVHKLSTFSTSSPDPPDGFWWNLVGMKYSWSLTSVVVFRPDLPRGGSRSREGGFPSRNFFIRPKG